MKSFKILFILLFSINLAFSKCSNIFPCDEHYQDGSDEYAACAYNIKNHGSFLSDDVKFIKCVPSSNFESGKACFYSVGSDIYVGDENVNNADGEVAGGPFELPEMYLNEANCYYYINKFDFSQKKELFPGYNLAPQGTIRVDKYTTCKEKEVFDIETKSCQPCSKILSGSEYFFGKCICSPGKFELSERKMCISCEHLNGSNFTNERFEQCKCKHGYNKNKLPKIDEAIKNCSRLIQDGTSTYAIDYIRKDDQVFARLMFNLCVDEPKTGDSIFLFTAPQRCKTDDPLPKPDEPEPNPNPDKPDKPEPDPNPNPDKPDKPEPNPNPNPDKPDPDNPNPDKPDPDNPEPDKPEPKPDNNSSGNDFNNENLEKIKDRLDDLLDSKDYEDFDKGEFKNQLNEIDNALKESDNNLKEIEKQGKNFLKNLKKEIDNFKKTYNKLVETAKQPFKGISSNSTCNCLYSKPLNLGFKTIQIEINPCEMICKVNSVTYLVFYVVFFYAFLKLFIFALFKIF
ncbi:hypothetical protein [Campylobacter ureolyticus]|uniref:hypothetical protein n=1 Tax=Campylobacter ureolyticus TaxID=827 RepID=UPI0026E972D1|nr:hypothetical protein [Campylobacter ureolyticus]